MAGLLTALLYGAGGYGQGRQQAVQNKQTQQQLDQEQAYRQAEERRQDEQLKLQQQKAASDQDALTRDRGIDPATGKPFILPPALTQLRPNNKGKGGPGTAQDQLNLLYAQANHMYQNGQLDQAAGIMDRAKNMENDIRTNLRLQQQAGIDRFNQSEQDRREANREYFQGILDDKRSSAQDRRDAQRNIDEDNREIQRENFQAGQNQLYRTRGGRKTGGAASVSRARSEYDDTWKHLTGQQVDSNGNKLPPILSGEMQQALQQKFLDISNDPNPQKKADEILKSYKGQPLNPNAALAIKRYGAWQQSEVDASKSGGVSDNNGNPTPGGHLPPASIWDMISDSGASPQEATVLTAIAMAESKGDPGAVNRKDNGGKQTSWGLFQVSDGTHHEPQGWQDPETNLQMALEKLRTQGLGAWGTYNSGAYKKYLPEGWTP